MKPNELIFDEIEFRNTVKNSKSISDLIRWYKKPKNGYYNNLFEKWIRRFGCDTSHFRKTETLSLVCDFCRKEFIVPFIKVNKNRRFCSIQCSNKKIKRGIVLCNTKEDTELKGIKKYVTICFRHHKKKCVVCDEENIVTVHHYDGNHDNDSPDNLVPVCPTHHSYIHSKFRYIVIDKIEKYLEDFKVNRAK